MYKWDEKYSVGIQSIDNQHKELFNHLNNLLNALKQGQASHITAQIVAELEKYTRIHFHKEEYFFHLFNFSGSKTHIAEHQMFIQKMNKLKSELKSGNISSTLDLLGFLKEWIEHHVLVVDKEYSECFRQNGLK